MNFGTIVIALMLRCCPCHQFGPKKTAVFKTGKVGGYPVSSRVNTFNRLVCGSKMFVDNSLLIKYVYEQEKLLIALPRAFGKSINLDMVATFFSLDVKHGTLEKLPQNCSRAYELFRNNNAFCQGKFRKLSSEFLISKVPDVDVFDDLGSVPVIKLNLGSCKFLRIPSHVLDEVKTAILTAVHDHNYILDAITSPPSYKMKYKNWLNILNSKDENYKKVSRVLPQLADTLYSIFNRSVYVLIDEYDAILNNIYFGSDTMYFDVQTRTDVVHFFSDFFGKLIKQCPQVSHVFMTGILCYQEAGFFSDSRVNFHTVSGGDATDFYGMNPEIVRELLKENNLENQFPIVSQHFNGYLFGNSRKNTLKFNPYVVASFLSQNNDDREAMNWWTQTSSVRTLLSQLIKYRRFHLFMLQLLLGQSIKLPSRINSAYIRVSDLDELTDLIYTAKLAAKEDFYSLKHPRNSDDLGFLILFSTGYITYENDTRDVYMKIPNEEIRNALSVDYYECFSHLPKKSDRYYVNTSVEWSLAVSNCQKELRALLSNTEVDSERFKSAFQRVIYSYLTLTRKPEHHEDYL